MQMPSIVVSQESDGYKMILAANVKMSSGEKRLLLSNMFVSEKDCEVNFELAGLTDKKDF